MAVDHKSWRRQSRQVSGALVNIEDPRASGAFEMVMVLLRHKLVHRALAREQYRLQYAVLLHRPKVPVHSGHSQPRYQSAGHFQYLLRRQRATL